MKVSIIIPVYNGESYVRKCLDSVVNQTYKDLEIIIINDGSKDDTLNILNSYKNKDKRIIIIDKVNEGQAIARNIALTKATGDFVTFVDSDDYVELDYIEKFINLAKKKDYDVAVCNHNLVNEDYENIGTKSFNIIPDDKINFMLTQCGPLGKMFKLSYLKKINFKFLENHIYEDLAVMPYVAIKTKKIEYLKEFKYNYLIRIGSTMNQVKYNPKLNDIFDALDNLTKLFNGKYSDELEYIYIKHLLHDASLRFLKFNNLESKKALNKINQIMRKRYPKWIKNKYLYLIDKKEVLLTKIIYNRWFFLYNLYRKVFK